MRDTPANWRNTSHDWAGDLDLEHLEQIRRDPAAFAPSGVLHLIFEVLAYAAEEAYYFSSNAHSHPLDGPA